MQDDEEPMTDDLAAGVVASIPIVGPALAPFAKRLSRRIRAEWQRNTSEALRAAEQSSGMRREELEDAISEDPRLVPLATRVLFTAGMTGQDQILRALGTVLGDAVREPDNIDEAELLLIGMEDLRRHHIVVLEVMSENPPTPSEPDSTPRWYGELIAERTGYSTDLANLCIAGLMNSGLVRALNTYGGTSYEISELGRTALDVMSRLNERNSGDE